MSGYIEKWYNCASISATMFHFGHSEPQSKLLPSISPCQKKHKSDTQMQKQ